MDCRGLEPRSLENAVGKISLCNTMNLSQIRRPSSLTITDEMIRGVPYIYFLTRYCQANLPWAILKSNELCLDLLVSLSQVRVSSFRFDNEYVITIASIGKSR